MSHAHDDRSRALGDTRARLADLTDAHVRALLDPGGCSPGDHEAAVSAGLAYRDHGYDHPTGRALLTEAQRIADGLTPDEALVLSRKDCRGTKRLASPLRDIRRSLHAQGLTRFDDSPKRTTLGNLVSALRERRETR